VRSLWSGAVNAVVDLSLRRKWNLAYRITGLLGPERQEELTFQLLESRRVNALSFERDGLNWTANLNDCIGRSLFRHGHYHGIEIAALLDWLTTRGRITATRNVFVDVGANIGTTSIPVARRGLRALAVEPAAHTCELLARNVEANHLGSLITIVRKAVLRKQGTVRMRVEKDSGGSWIDASAPEAGVQYEDVPAATLSEILAGVGIQPREVAVVWADVQGCEGEVIVTGSELWKEGTPLWAEVEPASLERQQGVAEFEHLAAAHFESFIVDEELVRLGHHAPVYPIKAISERIRHMAPQGNCNALLLPSSRS
jgi:FkbM family methyltransferase